MNYSDWSYFQLRDKESEGQQCKIIKKKEEESMICMALPMKTGMGVHYHNKCSATKSHFASFVSAKQLSFAEHYAFWILLC